MNKEQRTQRDADLVKDAATMTITEIAEKYSINVNYARRLLIMHGASPQRGRDRFMARIKALAPTSSYEDLQRALPEYSLATIRQAVSWLGLRIGMRKNVRGPDKGYQFKQLDILADLINHPEQSGSEIGIRHGVCRERVGQIKAHAQALGLVPILGNQVAQQEAQA